MEQRTVSFYELTFVDTTDGVMIGRYGTDTFAVFPEDGAALVKRLQSGCTIAEATTWYLETFREELDMEDFLHTLQELEFLRTEEATERPTDRVTIPWQRAGRLAFSLPAWILYALVLGCGVWLMLRYPELRPSRDNLLFSDYSTLVVLGLFVGQMPGVFFHEAMHLLAGRRLGLPSKLSIGRRMYLIVFESSMPGIWGVERKRRYLPLLVGMLGDLLWMCLMIMAAAGLWKLLGAYTWLSTFCTALAFTTILRFIWQFYFHLQTDIYYVIITLLGCINLQATTRAWLKNGWFRLMGRPERCTDLSQWAERDIQVARWYGPLYAVGWLAMVAVLLVVAIPVSVRFFTNVYQNLVGASTPHMWDSVVFLALMVLQYGVAYWLWRRERREHRKIKSLETQKG